jgi:hypothetical protein
VRSYSITIAVSNILKAGNLRLGVVCAHTLRSGFAGPVTTFEQRRRSAPRPGVFGAQRRSALPPALAAHSESESRFAFGGHDTFKQSIFEFFSPISQHSKMRFQKY